MLGLFKKDPVAKLQRQYERKLEAALDAQRRGRMPEFADLSAEAEAVLEQIDRLRKTAD